MGGAEYKTEDFHDSVYSLIHQPFISENVMSTGRFEKLIMYITCNNIYFIQKMNPQNSPMKQYIKNNSPVSLPSFPISVTALWLAR